MGDKTGLFTAGELIPVSRKRKTLSVLVSEALKIGEHVSELRYGLQDLRSLRNRLDALRVLYDRKQWKGVIEDLDNISKRWEAFESDEDLRYEKTFLYPKLNALPKANHGKWRCNVGSQLSSISVSAAGPGKPGVKKSLQNPMGDEPESKPRKPVMGRHNTYRPTKPQMHRPSTNRPTTPVIRSSTPRPAKPQVVKYSTY